MVKKCYSPREAKMKELSNRYSASLMKDINTKPEKTEDLQRPYDQQREGSIKI